MDDLDDKLKQALRAGKRIEIGADEIGSARGLLTVIFRFRSKMIAVASVLKIVAAWVLIQIGDIIATNYGAPPWVMGVVITFVVSGFPLVLFLSWTFALTTDGLRKESDVLKYDTLTRTSGHKLDYITMALLAVVVGMVTLDRYMPIPSGVEAVTQAVQAPAEPEPESAPEVEVPEGEDGDAQKT